jgi:Nif11 domain
MKKSSDPMAFLAKAQEDDRLSRRLIAALERGGQVTASEVLDIAQEFGYSFSRSEFEKAVKRDYVTRFAAGDESLADVARAKPKPKPPQSSCAKGCLSWTKSYCPNK